jgi:putative ABC transport system permease protein
MRWLKTKKRDAELTRELQSDLVLEEEEQRERGLSPEEARYAARRAFGNPALIREQTRAVWTWKWLEQLVRDLKYACSAPERSEFAWRWGHRERRSSGCSSGPH